MSLYTSTFGDMKAAMRRELYNRTDLEDEIQAAILNAVKFYEEEKWWWKEEQDTSLATVSGQPYIEMPDDYEYEDALTITYTNYPLPMIRRDWQTMVRFLISTLTLRGQPTDYAFYKGRIWFYPTPNNNYPLTFWKTRTLTPLSDDAEVNEWTTDAEELIRSRALADIRCHILREGAALQEMGVMAQMNQKHLSNRERSAYWQLTAKNQVRIGTSKISPHFF